MIFEGGGIKGLAYCGCIRVLEKLNLLENIKRYGGSSAGAITATLLAIGYNADEIDNIIRNTNFGSFLDDKVGFVRGGTRILFSQNMVYVVVTHFLT